MAEFERIFIQACESLQTESTLIYELGIRVSAPSGKPHLSLMDSGSFVELGDGFLSSNNFR